MADGKTVEDGEFFWQKCMVVRIKQSDPDRFGFGVDPRAERYLQTKKQVLKMNPHTYAMGESKFEQLRFMVEHAVDWRWETGWGADNKLMRQAKESFERRGEPIPTHDDLFEAFKRENVYLMVKLPAARAIEYRMRFHGQ